MSTDIDSLLMELRSLRVEVNDLRMQVSMLQSENKSLQAENKALRAENDLLNSEVKDFRLKLDQDSHNSSKPPSSDPVWKRSSRKSVKSNKKRKPGGQKGHKGYKLKKIEQIDHRVIHKLTNCPECGSLDLKVKGKVSRQVIDIPEPVYEGTEHEMWKYECQCCHNKIEAGSEMGLSQVAQYGIRLKSLVSYLNVYHIIPYKRLSEIVDHLYGLPISQGTISNFNKELQGKLQPFKEAVKSKFQNEAKILHSDETGCMVNKKLHWTHVYSDSMKTLLFGHEKRGKVAMEAIEILSQTNATVIHDRFGSYLKFDTLEHGLCNAHILRELTAIKDDAPDSWPEKIQELLLSAKKKKEQKGLASRQITLYVNKFVSILRSQRLHYQKIENQIKRETKRGKPKRTKDHNLYLALWKYRNPVFKFITDPLVPFDNYQAERDLRMLKIKIKVSNQFKRKEWLIAFLDIRSYVSTAIKQNRDVFDSILMAYQNPALTAQLAV